MTRPKNATWFAIGIDAWSLGAEAAWVIAMRGARLAMGGPNAGSEAQLMVAEKLAAGMDLGAKLAFGQLGASPEAIAAGTIRHYRRGVRANRNRLARR